MGGMALNTQPANALFDVFPKLSTPTWTAGMTITPITFTHNLSTCAPPLLTTPPEEFHFWLWGNIPVGINVDMNTGVLSGCIDPGTPPGSFGTFWVGCTSVVAVVACTDWSVPLIPWAGQVDWNILAFPGCAAMTVDPTPIPLCWEDAPFNMTCLVTGGVGPYTWTAAVLPAGLTMDAAGNITGAPALGTCNTFNNVTVTVTDTSDCVCLPATRTFILFVDCWYNYVPIIFTTTTTTTTGCDQTVEIGPGLTQGQTNLLVDGSHAATLAGGQQYTITGTPCEGHTAMVDQTVQPNSNTRFSVVGSNIKTFTEEDNYAYFDYAQEVNITTASDPSGATQPPGAGFYQVGGYFSSSVPGTIETDIQNGKKLVFDYWQKPDGTTWQNVNLGFTVNQGGIVTAKYKTYYRLRLLSDYPQVSDESWFPGGGNATWDVAVPRVPAQGFLGFFGVTQSARNAKGSQLINGPTDIPIQYEYNYLPLIISILVILLLIAGIIFLVRWLRSKPATQPVAKTRTRKASSRSRKRASK
jgi:hypothetical protein